MSVESEVGKVENLIKADAALVVAKVRSGFIQRHWVGLAALAGGIIIGLYILAKVV